jgi:flagellar protein FliS
MAVNPYTQYKNNAVNTASKGDLLIMLYDGAIKFCNQAIMAIEENNIENTNNYIIRVEDIILELQSVLDKKYEISKSLDALYDYMYRRLVEANIKKDKEIIEEVKELIKPLRDSFKKATVEARKTEQV